MLYFKFPSKNQGYRGIGGCSKRPFYFTQIQKSAFFRNMLKSSRMSFLTWVRKKKSWLRMCGVLERGKCISASYFCGPKLSSAASRNLRLAQPSGKFWTAKIQGQWREIQNSNFDSYFWLENGLISKYILTDLSQDWYSAAFGPIYRFSHFLRCVT